VKFQSQELLVYAWMNVDHLGIANDGNTIPRGGEAAIMSALRALTFTTLLKKKSKNAIAVPSLDKLPMVIGHSDQGDAQRGT